MKSWLLVVFLLLPGSYLNRSLAQDSSSLYNKVFSFPDKLFGSIDRKSSQLQDKLTKQTERYLKKLARQEKKLQRKLARQDSAAAARIFNGADSQYAVLQKGLTQTSRLTAKAGHIYNGHLDSVTTTLLFLQQNKLPGQSSDIQSRLQGSLSQLKGVQDKLDQTAAVRQVLEQRQQYLQEQLGKSGLAQQFRGYKETMYYYRAQMDEYKKAWENPSELEAKAMNMVSRTAVFRDFFNKHSALAGLFRLPGSGTPPAAIAANGLQTRDMLQQELLQRFGSGPNVQQSLQQSIGDAQSQLSREKDKLNQLLSKGGGDISMPAFKPNNQKTKSFLQRLEFGANVQSTRSNYFFPVTTDIGASLGYKLSDKSVTGIGVSYKAGWGRDIRHISVSHQGIGLRSFLEVKIKAGFWLSSGGELNYRAAFNNFSVLSDFSPWQKSALLGVTKKYNVGKKWKGNLQLLYDFLYRQQVPAAQPVVFRTGYVF